MIINYIYGFKINDVIYGFKEKKLFRLPQMIGLRFYPLKEVPLRKEIIGKSSWEGYLLRGQRKSLSQIKSLTVFINKEIEEINDSDCPF